MDVEGRGRLGDVRQKVRRVSHEKKKRWKGNKEEERVTRGG